MSQGIENKIISRIYGRGRGWAFTKTDFVAEFGESNIHQALSSLTKTGKIRRVCRGVYDYPRYSELLNRQLSPDLDQVAHALARKFNWRIQSSGDTALKPKYCRTFLHIPDLPLQKVLPTQTLSSVS